MTKEHIPPGVGKDAYNCAHCGSFARQHSGTLHRKKSHRNYQSIDDGYAHQCARCGQHSLWIGDELVYPNLLTAPRPHDKMPQNVKRDYSEARKVLNDSPRAAAALLRLAIQRLVEKELEAKGGSLYQQIGGLVNSGKISPRIQKALDAVRVIGNNSVHPGEMDMDDNRETAEALFMLVNEIIDEAIARDARIDDVYESLPEGPLEGIENRDDA